MEKEGSDRDSEDKRASERTPKSSAAISKLARKDSVTVLSSRELKNLLPDATPPRKWVRISNAN